MSASIGVSYHCGYVLRTWLQLIHWNNRKAQDEHFFSKVLYTIMKFYMVVKTWRPWPELYKKFVAVSKGPLMLIPFLQTCPTGFIDWYLDSPLKSGQQSFNSQNIRLTSSVCLTFFYYGKLVNQPAPDVCRKNDRWLWRTWVDVTRQWFYKSIHFNMMCSKYALFT
jgi:hypothetical protein